MTWLFGERWQDSAGVHEYSLALERILKLQKGRIEFFLHLALFVGVTLSLLVLVNSSMEPGYEYPPIGLFAFALIWLIVLALHANSVFPMRKNLMLREQEAGRAIQEELAHLQNIKRKNDDKLKRDAYYQIGDDGELIEVEQKRLRANPGENRQQSTE